MKVVLISILFFVSYLDILGTQSATVLPKSTEARDAVIEHFWRDYAGLLPAGAVPGGTDENGATTFLAQFTTVAEYNIGRARLHTIPAVLKLGSKYATAAYLGRSLNSNETTNTKIFCTNYPSRYKWYAPHAQFPINCRFVVGGYEDGIPMYIGRATHNKEVVVGKIFSDTTNHREGLICPYNGGVIYPDTYTILTYCV